MGLIRDFLEPKSKYDRDLPYTYMAKEAIIRGDEDLFSYYYADTLCGLVEYLDKEGIFPHDVEIFGLYRGEEKKLDKNIFLDRDERWLFRPEICRALEEYFDRTKDNLYKGHKEHEVCSFDDRDRNGEGP